MKYIALLFLSFMSFSLAAQTKTNGSAPLKKEIYLSDTTAKDLAPTLNSLDKHPIPASEYGNKKEILHKKRMELNAVKKKRGQAGEVAKPEVVLEFGGNVASGAPNDNDVAVSNDGIIVSAVNSNIRVYNSTGGFLKTRSLQFLASQLGSFSHNSDPRLLYDPVSDRFIIVWFTGNLSTTNKIIVGFTKSNDPGGYWNFYTLNGNSFNDSTWSDYPIIAISDKDLFITFNQVKDNVHWSTGFKQSVIWQVDKQRGYDSDSLKYTLWSDIKHEGNYLRNICPAKYQTDTLGNNMYFISVKCVDNSNDSLFLLEVTESYESGNAELKQTVLKSPLKYGFPPNAIQTKVNGVAQQLMTNDARVLAAIYENEQIHFGSNSVLPSNLTATVFLGTIKNINSNPVIEAKLLDEPGLEFGYPSMAYVGNKSTDHKVIFTFSHCITDSFAGTSIIYKDAHDDFSDVIRLKEGESVINVFSDSIERWGDYTNIQRLYTIDTQAFLTGSYGRGNWMQTWLVQLKVSDTTKGVDTIGSSDTTGGSSRLLNSKFKSELNLYPNPIKNNRFHLSFSLDKNEDLNFELFDHAGKLVSKLLKQKAYQGKNEFSMNMKDLERGIYMLRISGEKTLLREQHILVE